MYKRKGKQKSVKREVFVFDTEDDSKGNVIYIIFYNGKKFYTFKTREKAQKFIRNYPVKVVCWAVNLEYDIINTFKNMYAKIIWRFGKSQLISCSYKKFLFYNTLNHWKISVKGMGEYLGLKKLKMDVNDIKYCKRDCKITFRFVSKMYNIYESLGCENVNSTMPSTIFNLWREKYNNIKLRKIPKDILQIFKKAYYGGRTECFFIGDFKKPVKTVDVNSLYPYEMLKKYPQPFIYHREYKLNSMGLTWCKVKCNMQLPILPFRWTDKKKVTKLIFPNGIFSGWWTNAELKYASSFKGFKILKVYDSYTFDVECYPFKKFILSLYEIKKNGAKHKDKIMEKGAKLGMCSLYGKFAQGNNRSYVMSRKNFLNTYNKLNIDRVNAYDDICTFNKPGEYPLHVNMIWSIYTTAYARIHMHEIMVQILKVGGVLIYTDTDSIMYHYKGELKSIIISDKLGDFKDTGTFDGITIKLPKMYCLYVNNKYKYVVKGIGKKYQKKFFNNGVVTYKKPIKFRESLRRNLEGNLWLNHTKHLLYTYNKGIVHPGGKVTPLILK